MTKLRDLGGGAERKEPPDARLSLALVSREDGSWRMAVAVGRPGMQHARDVAASFQECSDEHAAALLGAVVALRPDVRADVETLIALNMPRVGLPAASEEEGGDDGGRA
jgi:hypothetical protein